MYRYFTGHLASIGHPPGMKTTSLAFLLTMTLCAAPAPAQAHAKKDLVQTAASDARFTTLIAAVKGAELVEALQGEGPFTVFAPTNEAFGHLPAGTVATLLEPAQRAALQRILLFHVVKGRVLSSDLLKSNAAGTLASAPLSIGLRVGDANVIQADIECANGVIHVIDRVLLPPKPAPTVKPAATEMRPRAVHGVVATIEDAIDRGVPVFNGGDHAGCAHIYAEAAKSILKMEALSPLDRGDVHDALHRDVDSAAGRAWALREAFDRVILNDGFKPTIEASMPPGFPAPGPVGRIVLKQYPQYRAARAEGGNSFWQLFRHIKANSVEMTAPVEMTMSDGMRARDMAFLYEGPSQGRTGRQGSVAVVDLAPMQVLSIGIRGRRNAKLLTRARALIEKYMTDGGWQRSGDWRVLGYNSPMVPSSRQYWELQIPVSR